LANEKINSNREGLHSVLSFPVKKDLIVTHVGNIRQIRVIARATLALLITTHMQLSASDVEAASLKEEQHCLALSIYWEARGEGRRGMIAVGWTVLNRVQSQLFPETPCTVVHQGGEQPPCQFSWWCDGRSDRPRNPDQWRRSLLIASELLLDPPPDPTGGSLFYHSSSIPTPWKQKRIRTVRIGSHVFYR
jgi:spore germination cell wall hydrolase CwlJ-like protein